MINADGAISIYRKMPNVDSIGRLRNEQDCTWVKVEDIKCVKVSNISDELRYNRETEVNFEQRRFHFDSYNQDKDTFDIRKTDFIVFNTGPNMDNLRTYQITVKLTRKLINNCCQYVLWATRLEPRDCGFKGLSCESNLIGVDDL